MTEGREGEKGKGGRDGVSDWMVCAFKRGREHRWGERKERRQGKDAKHILSQGQLVKYISQFLAFKVIDR